MYMYNYVYIYLPIYTGFDNEPLYGFQDPYYPNQYNCFFQTLLSWLRYLLASCSWSSGFGHDYVHEFLNYCGNCGIISPLTIFSGVWNSSYVSKHVLCDHFPISREFLWWGWGSDEFVCKFPEFKSANDYLLVWGPVVWDSGAFSKKFGEPSNSLTCSRNVPWVDGG